MTETHICKRCGRDHHPWVACPDELKRLDQNVNFNLSALEQPALYLVWSNEHGAWWRPNMAGYTVKLADAGRYTHREAVKICQHARDRYDGNGVPSEVPVALADMVEIVT